MKSVSIIAATISGNRGAEAMLTTTIGEIRTRFPDCHCNVFSYYPEQDSRLTQDKNLTIYSATPAAIVCVLFPFSLLFALCKLPLLNKLQNLLPKAVMALDQSELLIDLAGVAFIDGREKFLPYNILTLVPAFILNTPVIKLSQALGPFENRLNHFLAKHTLKQCKQIFSRGAGTFAHMQSLKLDNLFPAPVADVAFRHRQEYSLSTENQDRVAQLSEELKQDNNPIIGICPSSVLAAKSLNDADSYSATITRLCHKLRQQGYSILLFPNATRHDQGNKLRNNDLPVIQSIADDLISANQSADGIYKVDFDINTNGIKQLMPFCKTVMVSRFHAMIAALSAKQPVIVLGWSHKYKEVMDSFDLGALVYDFKQADMTAILASIESIIEDDSQITEKLERYLQPNLDSSFQQFEYLFKTFE